MLLSVPVECSNSLINDVHGISNSTLVSATAKNAFSTSFSPLVWDYACDEYNLELLGWR
jgi:hypothetical protein